ncbi:MAG: aminoglycoside phosphotransferase family protein [Myxococcota bacterium]
MHGFHVVPELQNHLARWVEEHFPGARLKAARPLAPDTGAGATGKAEGYGQPLRLDLELADGGIKTLVLRTQTANEFGHDRRADRAAGTLLAYDTFRLIPQHIRALDVGAIRQGGRLLSLADAGELYLLTEFARGEPYAQDLRRVGAAGEASALDVRRAEALALYLARLHQRLPENRAAYRRSVRDLVGHGEGIFGIVDGYPSKVPAAPPERLRRIEERCLQWRWRLRSFEQRLARIHGDFHPFNVLFQEDTQFALLDASRGCQGDPADDVTAMAVNYVFFALDARRAWSHGFGVLWRRFFDAYLGATGDRQMLEAAPPYFAWRALVVCNPRFYPSFSARGRDALLSLAEQALESEVFLPLSAEALFS